MGSAPARFGGLRGLVLGGTVDGNGLPGLTCLDLASGAVRFNLPLRERGHGMALHPTLPLIAVADRRPGRRLHVCHLDNAELTPAVEATVGRHFQGHVTWEPSGRFLYATENVYDPTAEDLSVTEAVVGVYDGHQSFARVGELRTYGVGAHELLWSDATQGLVVALGGIHTHPAFPDQGLNPDAMDPSVVFLGPSGARLANHRPAERRSSLRHLALLADGAVLVAAQRQDLQQTPDALLLRMTLRGAEALPASTASYAGLAGYTSSIAADPTSGSMVVASPRGDCMLVLDAAGKQLASHHEVEVSGLAALDGHFIASAGTGRLVVLSAGGAVLAATTVAGVAWDNHLLAVPADRAP